MIMSRDDLGAFLADLATRVREGDSIEGSLEYSIPSNKDDWDRGLEVVASVRIGNLDGQGGIRLIEPTELPVDDLTNDDPDGARDQPRRDIY